MPVNLIPESASSYHHSEVMQSQANDGLLDRETARNSIVSQRHRLTQCRRLRCNGVYVEHWEKAKEVCVTYRSKE